MSSPTPPPPTAPPPVVEVVVDHPNHQQPRESLEAANSEITPTFEERRQAFELSRSPRRGDEYPRGTRHRRSISESALGSPYEVQQAISAIPAHSPAAFSFQRLPIPTISGAAAGALGAGDSMASLSPSTTAGSPVLSRLSYYLTATGAISRNFFVSPLLEGLSDEERAASFFCTTALTNRAGTLSSEEKERFENLAPKFKSCDLSQHSSLARVVLKYLHRHPLIHIERIHLSLWDASLLRLLPSDSLKVLVLTGTKAINDHCAAIIASQCGLLESISIENTNSLSDAGLRSLATIKTMKTIWLAMDRPISESVLKICEGRLIITMVFKESLKVLESTHSIAKMQAFGLTTICKEGLKKLGHYKINLPELRLLFEQEWQGVEQALTKIEGMIPIQSLNHRDALMTLQTSFWSYFIRNLDLTSLLMARKSGKLPSDIKVGGESRPSKWLTDSDCTIRFTRPENVPEEEWELSLLINGETRHLLRLKKAKWVRYAPFLAWVGEGCKALDWSHLEVRDSDISVLHQCFPLLSVLILTTCPLLTNNGLLRLGSFTDLRFIRVSGIPRLSPSLIESIRRKGVDVEYTTITNYIQGKLETVVPDLCAQFQKEMSFKKLFTEEEAVQRFVGRIASTSASLEVDSEVIRAAWSMILQMCAQQLETWYIDRLTVNYASEIVPQHQESLLSESEVADVWRSHLLALYELYGAEESPLDTTAPEQVASASQQQRVVATTPSVVNLSTITLPKLPEPTSLKVGAPEVPKGRNMRDECLMFLFSHGVVNQERDIGNRNAFNINAERDAEIKAQHIAQLWRDNKKHLIESLESYFEESFTPLVRAGFGLIREEAKEVSLKMLSVRNELRTILQDSGPMSRSEASEDALIKAHQSDNARHSLRNVVAFLREMKLLNRVILSYFSGKPANRLCSEALLAPEEIFSLWRLIALERITRHFSPLLSFTDSTFVSLLRDVTVCWLFAEDPVLIVQANQCGLLPNLMEDVDVNLLWDSALWSMEPQYGISSKEALLSIEENWKSFTLARYKPEKPHGMSSRSYLLNRVFSTIFHTCPDPHHPIDQATKLEKVLWSDTHAAMLSHIDFCETDSPERISALLLYLRTSGCQTLTHVNLQGTHISTVQLRELPPTIKGLALSGCMLHDSDVMTIVQLYPLIELLTLRNCDELTDRSLMALDHLHFLRYLDISGALLTTHKQRAHLRSHAIHLCYSQFTTEVSNRLSGEMRPMVRSFLQALSDRIVVLSKGSINLDFPGITIHELLGKEIVELLPNLIFTSVRQHLLPPDIQDRLEKRTLKQCLSLLTPLGMLILESAHIIEIDRLRSQEMQQIWNAIYFGLLPASEAQKKITSPSDSSISWRQRAIEYHLSHTVFPSAIDGFSSLALADRILWWMSRSLIKTLDLASVLHYRVVQDLLEDLGTHSLVLDQVVINSVLAINLGNFYGSAVRQLVVFGDPLPTEQHERVSEFALKFKIDLQFVHRPPTETKPQTLSILERDSWHMASQFIVAMKHEVLQAAKTASSVHQLPSDLFDHLFLAAKAFLKDVEDYLKQNSIPTQSSEAAQFLFNCMTWLDVPQLIILEYSGVILRLAPNQLDYIWHNVFVLHGLHDEEITPDTNAKELVIGECISSLLREDSLDMTAMIILHCCSHKIQKLDLRGITPFPKITCPVTEITVAGGDTSLTSLLVSLPDYITFKDELKVLRIHKASSELLNDNLLTWSNNSPS